MVATWRSGAETSARRITGQSGQASTSRAPARQPRLERSPAVVKPIASVGALALSPATPARPDPMFAEKFAEMQAPPAETCRLPYPPRCGPGRHLRAGLSALALALAACSDSTPPEPPPKS